ncbi:hypothetical protein LST1_06690 [Neisseria elongata]|uniref:hypothetical protein n=1 Tax=Neisseria elongata TaxID=495 RepID=UPI002852DE41|nr:hypothetical protein LST1_06690 [Neisseria elongata]
MKKLSAVIVLLLLSGCASIPVDTNHARKIDPRRVLAYAEPKEDYARVEIIRDSGILGSGCYFGVMYRNTVLARFAAGEKAVFYLPEGDWKFAVVRDPQGMALCGVGDLNPVFETQQIRKDRENLFRISFGPYRRPRLLPM